jgi:hypothetical protein
MIWAIGKTIGAIPGAIPWGHTPTGENKSFGAIPWGHTRGQHLNIKEGLKKANIPPYPPRGENGHIHTQPSKTGHENAERQKSGHQPERGPKTGHGPDPGDHQPGSRRWPGRGDQHQPDGPGQGDGQAHSAGRRADDDRHGQGRDRSGGGQMSA